MSAGDIGHRIGDPPDVSIKARKRNGIAAFERGKVRDKEEDHVGDYHFRWPWTCTRRRSLWRRSQIRPRQSLACAINVSANDGRSLVSCQPSGSPQSRANHGYINQILASEADDPAMKANIVKLPEED